MLILGIEASAQAASVALYEDKLLACRYLNGKQNHSQILMPMLEGLLLDCSVLLKDIDYIALSQGPGSFTGLRIACAFAKGICKAANKKIIPVPTLKHLAYNVVLSDSICPVMDAKKNEVYTALYSKKGHHLEEIIAPQCVSLSEFLQVLHPNRPITFVGDAIFTYENLLKQMKNSQFHFVEQNAVSLCAYAKYHTEDAISPSDFHLMYLRKPQAQKDWEEKHGVSF